MMLDEEIIKMLQRRSETAISELNRKYGRLFWGSQNGIWAMIGMQRSVSTMHIWLSGIPFPHNVRIA